MEASLAEMEEAEEEKRLEAERGAKGQGPEWGALLDPSLFGPKAAAFATQVVRTAAMASELQREASRHVFTTEADF